MTGLTGNVSVHAFALHIEHVDVTVLTNSVSGEHYRLGCNLGKGGAPVVAILPEALGNEQTTHHEEHDDSGGKD